MRISDLETPEALFGWLAARGALSAAEAQAAIEAVRAGGPDAGAAPAPASPEPLTDEEAMAVALADLERLDAERGTRR
jgi:hypothetical protein